MTDAYGYDLHSIPNVFHIVRTCRMNRQTYSVGFDIAYPRMGAMRRPKGRGKQDSLDPRSFRCVV